MGGSARAGSATGCAPCARRPPAEPLRHIRGSSSEARRLVARRLVPRALLAALRVRVGRRVGAGARARRSFRVCRVDAGLGGGLSLRTAAAARGTHGWPPRRRRRPAERVERLARQARVEGPLGDVSWRSAARGRLRPRWRRAGAWGGRAGLHWVRGRASRARGLRISDSGLVRWHTNERGQGT